MHNTMNTCKNKIRGYIIPHHYHPGHLDTGYTHIEAYVGSSGTLCEKHLERRMDKDRTKKDQRKQEEENRQKQLNYLVKKLAQIRLSIRHKLIHFYK